MNSNVLKFEKNWSILNTPGEGSEAHYKLLVDLAKLDKEVLILVKTKFKDEVVDGRKEYLALIAVNNGLKEPFVSYLKEIHGWVDSDFKGL